LYRKLLDRGRLTLPSIAAESLAPAAGTVQFPLEYPLFAGEDTPLEDMLFLLNLAKGRKAGRILEVGTYRARTTLAFHLNCPEAEIVSYDIQALESPFREVLRAAPGVQLRLASFIESAPALRREERFDVIFVDGSHFFEHVIADSRLALELVSPKGIIVWHDYRPNNHARQNELRVPEALAVIRRDTPVFAVPRTMCAVHVRGGMGGGPA
jgi:predicted O-methyltransferase YrrM